MLRDHTPSRASGALRFSPPILLTDYSLLDGADTRGPRARDHSPVDATRHHRAMVRQPASHMRRLLHPEFRRRSLPPAPRTAVRSRGLPTRPVAHNARAAGCIPSRRGTFDRRCHVVFPRSWVFPSSRVKLNASRPVASETCSDWVQGSLMQDRPRPAPVISSFLKVPVVVGDYHVPLRRPQPCVSATRSKPGQVPVSMPARPSHGGQIPFHRRTCGRQKTESRRAITAAPQVAGVGLEPTTPAL